MKTKQEIIAEFNAGIAASGKTDEQIDAEYHAEREKRMAKVRNDPEIKALWSEAEAETDGQ